MTASLATQLRAIAADPTPAAIAELAHVAVQVHRLERALDDIAADALEGAVIDDARKLALQHARRDGRRYGHLVVIG